MYKRMLFFGDYAPAGPSVPTPYGLRCYHCDQPFFAVDLGVVFEKESTSRAAHKDCFVNNAVKSFQAKFID